MNIKDLGEYEVEETPTISESKPLNLADIGEFEVEEASKPDEMDSALRGAAQGASFSFADELTGAGEAAGRTLFGKDKITDLLDNYKKYRDESRQNYDTAQKTNPSSYMAGELGGGLASGLATGGAGIVGNVGKVGLGQLIKQGAITGAKQGAVAGLGSSEADLTEGDILGATKDTTMGAGLGGAIGGALPAVVQGAKSGLGAVSKVAGKAKDSLMDIAPESVHLANDAFDLTNKGVAVVGDKAAKKVNSDSVQLAEDILNNIQTQYKTGSKMVGKALEKSDVGPQNVSSQMRELEKAITSQKIQPEDVAKIQQTLDLYKREFVKEGISESGVDKALNKLQTIVNKAKAQGDELGYEINEQAPKVLEDLGIVQRTITETTPEGNIVPRVLQADIPEDTITKEVFEGWNNMSIKDLQNLKQQMGDLAFNSENLEAGGKRQASQAYKMVNDILESKIKDPKLKSLYESGNKKMSNVHQASDLFGEVDPTGLSEKNINTFAEKLKSNTDKNANMFSSLSDLVGDKGQGLIGQAEELATRKNLSKTLAGEGSMFGMVSPRAIAVRAGAAGGSLKKSLYDNPSKFVGKLTNLGDDLGLKAASSLQGSADPNIQAMGRKLENALSSSDKKDRLIWALSQQPAFREALLDSFPELDNETDNEAPQS